MPSSAIASGSYRLRPSKMTGILSSLFRCAKSGLLNSFHSVTITSASAPGNASFCESTKCRRSSCCGLSARSSANILRPDGLHRLDPFARQLVAAGEDGAVVLDLVLVPAIADAEQEAAVGQLV